MNVSQEQTLFAAKVAATLAMELAQSKVKETQAQLEKDQSALAEKKAAAVAANKAFRDVIDAEDSYGEPTDAATPVIKGTPISDGSTIIDPVRTDPTGQAVVDAATGAAGPANPTPMPDGSTPATPARTDDSTPPYNPVPMPTPDAGDVVKDEPDSPAEPPAPGTPMPASTAQAAEDQSDVVKDGDTVAVVKTDPTSADGKPA